MKLVRVDADEKAGVREARKRVAGSLAHLRSTKQESDWLAPLSEDELQAWEGKYSSDPDQPDP